MLTRITYREMGGLLSPLLQRRPDLIYEGGFLLFVPFSHYARGVAFGISRFGKSFTAYTFACQVFAGLPTFLHRGSEGQVTYSVSEEWVQHPQETSIEFCDFLENKALPEVEPIVNPIEHEKRPQYLPDVRDMVALKSPRYAFVIALGACFYGDFDKAQRILANIERHLCTPPTPYIFPLMLHLLDLLRTDRSKIPALMHEWEELTVKLTKVKKRNWKRTPFPCEEQKPSS